MWWSVVWCNVMLQDLTEKHFGDFGILRKYYLVTQICILKCNNPLFCAFLYELAALFSVLEHLEHCSGTVLNGVNREIPEHIYVSLKHKCSCHSAFLSSIYST